MALTKISTGGVKDDAASQAKIADEAVDEARLQVSNAGTNGQFLSKQSGNTGGLTWATVTVPDADKVIEGNTSVEAVDTGSDGHVKITTEGTERVRVDENGRILVNTTTEGHGSADELTVSYNNTGVVGGDQGRCGMTIRSGVNTSSVAQPGYIFFSDGTSGDGEYKGSLRYKHSDDSLEIASNATTALTLDSSQNATFAGTVSDSKGNLRSVPVNSQGSTYTLVAADAGKAVALNFTNGSCTINTSIFAAGDVVTIINASTTDKTITKGSGLNLYNSADGTDANRTLSAKGMATLIFVSHDGAYISGSGLS